MANYYQKEVAELLDVALRLDIILYGTGDLHRRALFEIG